jgi:hypothetical protein
MSFKNGINDASWSNLWIRLMELKEVSQSVTHSANSLRPPDISMNLDMHPDIRLSHNDCFPMGGQNLIDFIMPHDEDHNRIRSRNNCTQWIYQSFQVGVHAFATCSPNVDCVIDFWIHSQMLCEVDVTYVCYVRSGLEITSN